MCTPSKLFDRRFETKQPSDDFHKSCEQRETWFLGSLMRDKNIPQRPYNRLSTLHNRITHEETKFDERLQINKRITANLAEFFPFKWLLEITSVFRKINPSKLGIKTYENRVCSYLGYIELYLNFRGLTILDSTLIEINNYLGVNTSKSDVRCWKLKILRNIPEIQDQWIRIRAKTHQTALFSTVVQIMNHELDLDHCSKKEIFQIKQMALIIARKFIKTKKAQYVKKPETWARAICKKAVQEIFPDYPCLIFPRLSHKTQKVIDNKRWQLDKLIG